ncbi:uncharacterized protein LOC123562299 [Mercenaria mercenaria]|uniref:uncharacterized protein LOC123562299 n=1 Tax=Mercenaria mercenaria TaxID=6596 RepID=UPI00234E8357|nr:uncharacterized protein LOC123562299 [Mercenaria mercenaria]
MKRSIAAIVPHSFGSHDACADHEWCRFKLEKDYKRKSLPHCKDLADDFLKKDLEDLMGKYTTPAMCRKLAELQSTNSVENMNQLIARKAPKSMHFSGSESLDYRVSAAATQKNEGSSYICTVNETHKMTPGKVTAKRFQGIDRKRG